MADARPARSQTPLSMAGRHDRPATDPVRDRDPKGDSVSDPRDTTTDPRDASAVVDDDQSEDIRPIDGPATGRSAPVRDRQDADHVGVDWERTSRDEG